MAIRKIRQLGDECLTKVCKEVKMISPRTKILVQDMFDTMYEAGGVGLAAPQVGVLKRIVVIDVDDNPHVLINPEILETSGEQTGYEGCLSYAGKSGIVTRPNYAKVKALNLDGEEYILEGEELLAGAFAMNAIIWKGSCMSRRWKAMLWIMRISMRKKRKRSKRKFR